MLVKQLYCKMKLFVFCAFVGLALAAPKQNFGTRVAEDCSPEKCKLPDCRCIGSDIPGGFKPEETPQFVYLTFDDAVSTININYYRQAFNGRKNPDGCPVQATYYISHEYTDYSLVNELYRNGHEIALHSITHQSSTAYWSKLTKDQLIDEFGGERKLMARFANIPEEDIKGMRMPLLQLAGDNSFAAGKDIGLTYDCSWPSMSASMWPYTLDYKSTQECSIPPCPTSSIPGFWVQPMLNLKDKLGTMCSMVDACTNIDDDVEDVFNFMKTNFERTYKGNRAPIGFYMHAAWFGRLPEHSFEGYVKFLDYLQSLKDVYVIGVERGLEWVRNPVKLGGQLWPSCAQPAASPCQARACQLKKGQEERYMTQCLTQCPNTYPWLGNPLGE